jgi:hypothetical protein
MPAPYASELILCHLALLCASPSHWLTKHFRGSAFLSLTMAFRSASLPLPCHASLCPSKTSRCRCYPAPLSATQCLCFTTHNFTIPLLCLSALRTSDTKHFVTIPLRGFALHFHITSSLCPNGTLLCISDTGLFYALPCLHTSSPSQAITIPRKTRPQHFQAMPLRNCSMP